LFNRNRGFHSQQHRSRISRQIRRAGAVDFFNLLTGPELLEMTEMHLPEHRERLYPPTVALSMFMKQSLAVDRSCQRAVDAWAAQRAAEGLNVQSIRTGAYCRSRARLPLEMIIALTRESGRLLSARAQRGWRWRGRCVKLADGTGISMPDTPENQARYPQPLSQAEGVGFPLAGLVGIVCLSTGAVLEAAIGAHASKGQSEQDLFRGLLSTLRPGDVLLADALYCSYFLIATLQAAGVDVLFEQHGSRHTDFRRGRVLGRRDHVVCWPKPTTRPAWMSREQYRAFPEQLSVREAKVDGQVLVTTMLNAPQVRKSELASLYARRWHVGVSSQRTRLLVGESPTEVRRPRPRSLGGIVARKQDDGALRQHTLKGACAKHQVVMCSERRGSLVTRFSPVAETVDNARRQQELGSKGPMRRFSPAGYQRRHDATEDVETGETLDARRGKPVEEIPAITVSGKGRCRHQGGGSGRSTEDGRAAKRARREGPGPVGTAFVKVRQG